MKTGNDGAIGSLSGGDEHDPGLLAKGGITVIVLRYFINEELRCRWLVQLVSLQAWSPTKAGCGSMEIMVATLTYWINCGRHLSTTELLNALNSNLTLPTLYGSVDASNSTSTKLLWYLEMHVQCTSNLSRTSGERSGVVRTTTDSVGSESALRVQMGNLAGPVPTVRVPWQPPSPWFLDRHPHWCTQVSCHLGPART